MTPEEQAEFDAIKAAEEQKAKEVSEDTSKKKPATEVIKQADFKRIQRENMQLEKDNLEKEKSIFKLTKDKEAVETEFNLFKESAHTKSGKPAASLLDDVLTDIGNVTKKIFGE